MCSLMGAVTVRLTELFDIIEYIDEDEKPLLYITGMLADLDLYCPGMFLRHIFL